jgi:hypothetical protein
MSTFYVHIVDDDGRAVDTLGYEAADVGDIIRMVRETAAEIILLEVATGVTSLHLEFHIEDDQHRELLVLPVDARIPASAEQDDHRPRNGIA